MMGGCLPCCPLRHCKEALAELGRVRGTRTYPSAMRSLSTIPSHNCDTLFVKGAGTGRTCQSLPAVPAPPPGFQRYREQLWSNPAGQLRYNMRGLRLRICHGDILEHSKGADAVINAANKNLSGPARPEYWMFSSYAGHSVDEVIHRAAGAELQEACRQLQFCGGDGIRCPIGKARATPGTASLLPTGFIIHAVAPGWHSAETSSSNLMGVWRSSLDVAAELGVKVLAAPALGCGTNRTPFAVAASCALAALRDWSNSEDYPLEVRLVLHTFESWVSWTDVAFNMFGK